MFQQEKKKKKKENCSHLSHDQISSSMKTEINAERHYRLSEHSLFAI